MERVLANAEELTRARTHGVDAWSWSLADVVAEAGTAHLRTCTLLDGAQRPALQARTALSTGPCHSCLEGRWPVRVSSDRVASGCFEVLMWLSCAEEALERAERGEDLRALGGALASAQGAASAALAQLSGDAGLVRWQEEIEERARRARDELKGVLRTTQGRVALKEWVSRELGPRELTSEPHHGHVLVMTGLGWAQRTDELADAVLVVLEASRVLVDEDLAHLRGSSVALRVSAETADLMAELGMIDAEVPCEDEALVIQMAVQLWREAGKGRDPERDLDWALEVARELV